MKRLRSVLTAESGSSLVEYAIVFAVLLTMLPGIAEFSRALYAFHYVSSTAREAARFAPVRGLTCTNDGSCAAPATTGDIQTFAQNAPLGIDGSRVTATATWPV
jgi:Flp pilus assembly protein TadG